MPFISRDKLKTKLESKWHDGVKEGLARGKKQINTLEIAAVERQDKLDKATAELKVLRADRDKVRTVMQTEMEQADNAFVLAKQKQLQDARDKRLDEREAKIGDEESSLYKGAYADGVADGLRRIGEITKEDRDNMAKIAMVSAARGTDPAAVQGVADALRITEGTPTTTKAK